MSAPEQGPEKRRRGRPPKVAAPEVAAPLVPETPAREVVEELPLYRQVAAGFYGAVAEQSSDVLSLVQGARNALFTPESEISPEDATATLKEVTIFGMNIASTRGNVTQVAELSSQLQMLKAVTGERTVATGENSSRRASNTTNLPMTDKKG